MYEWIMPVALIIGLVVLLSLNGGSGAELGPEEAPLIEAWLEVVVIYVAGLAELAAALVIGVAVLRGLGGFVRSLFSPPPGRITNTDDTRLELGRALVLGLEFTVASDILRTAVAPTREDLVILGVVVMLRTLLNTFLEREIHEAEERRRLQAEAQRTVTD